MTTLVEFPVDRDNSVLVEVEGGPPLGLAPVADSDVAGKSTRTFEEAVSGLGGIAKSLFNTIQGIARRPTEVSVELGFKIAGSGTLILCSTQAEANFKATLKWVDAPKT